MTNHADDDEPRARSAESPTDVVGNPATHAPMEPDDDPGLPASGIWLAVLLRGDTPLMRCGF